MNILSAKEIYMIGIKGVGMTMLAQFLSSKGIRITGSDTGEKFMTDAALAKSGIKVIEGFDPENIPRKTDLIIHSSAYNPENNLEMSKISTGNYKIMSYAEALSGVFNMYYGIGVSGSHGKTTTSAWLGYVLEKAGKSPNVLVGATVPQFDGSGLVGMSDYFIAELDEYQNKLRYFSPKAVLLNNIEFDHPDFFSSEEEYRQVFIDFMSRIPKAGFLVANMDDPFIRKTANVNCRARVIGYAIDENADLTAYEIKQESGLQYFRVKLAPSEDDEPGDLDLGSFAIKLPGRHNIYNALAVIAASIELELDLAVIRTYLEEFEGTTRRMQLMGKFRGASIYDDYAHHPTEIRSTLAGARQFFPGQKIRVVFHPHTFTRTKAMLKEFAQSFNDADEVMVLDIYGSAREEHGGVHSRELVELIKSVPSKYVSDLKNAEEYIRQTVSPDEIIILMGAGDVFRIGENLVK
jgi:UDP-N-acetylmuramate--alanine ligase